MSDEQQPTFFRGRRISVYCQGGRLFKDKKTEKRYWRLKLALTLRDADAYACNSGPILSNYQQIQARQNACGRIEIDGGALGQVATFYAIEDVKADPLIVLSGSFIDGLALTWADGITELWMSLEHENSDKLHKFVKDYAFSRFYVEFKPAQRSLTEIAADVHSALDSMDKLAGRDGGSWSLTDSKGTVLAKSKDRIN